ncbi:MAG: serine/threonine-protein phosphatase [Actinomycetota bacterium]
MAITQRQTMDTVRGSIELRVSAESHMGASRDGNGDAFLVLGSIFLVADGTGGYPADAHAAQMVVQTFAGRFAGVDLVTADDVLDAIGSANQAVLSLSGDSPGAAAAVAGLGLMSSESGEDIYWLLFNVGNSRVYTWSDSGFGTFSQLTVDHSVAQEYVDNGLWTRLEAAHSPARKAITRVLGLDSRIDPDVWLLPISQSPAKTGFLLCSDGLTERLNDDEIARVLGYSQDRTDSPAERLIGAARALGAADDVTAIVIECTREAAG